MQIQNNGKTTNGSGLHSPGQAELIPTVDHFRPLAASLERRAAERKRALLRVLKSIPALSWYLDPAVELHGRIKSLLSISEKMLQNGLGVHQVLDIIGIRAVTEHTRDCYRLVRRIHSEFPALEREYDDYIAAPKSNGYRSLHTTVMSPCGLPVEIQVRTHVMHEACERGAAAHSKYKNQRNRVAWMPLSSGSPIVRGVA